jgi:dolichyl-phosphate-mannose--protein O-mannosyl transferase
MAKRKRASSDEEFLASLADGSLYSMGAYFSDQHPELVDEVIAQAEGIESRGLRGYAEDSGMSVEEAYETLMTGLAVRYYNAVAG